MTNYERLKSFSLQLDNYIPDTIYQALRAKPLKSLSLNCKISEVKDCLALTNCLKTLQGLEVLEFQFFYVENNSQKVLFQYVLPAISDLKLLKVLSIKVKRIEVPDNTISSFSKVLDELPKIQEIAFCKIKGDYRNEFASLVKTLDNKALNLTRLELGILDNRLKSQDVRDFTNVLEKMRLLRSLYLNGSRIAIYELKSFKTYLRSRFRD